MDFKNKAHLLIDTMNNEQVICLVNFIEVFTNIDNRQNRINHIKSEPEKVTPSSEKKITAVYSVEDIMKILNIGRNSAYDLIKEAPFPIIRIGKTIRIPKEPFEEWMK